MHPPERQEVRTPGESPPRWVTWALWLVLALLAGRLLFGDTPWSSSLAERAAEGKLLRPKDFARTYGWWAAAVLLPVVAALLATRPLWLRLDAPRVYREFSARPLSRPVVALLALAVITGGLLAAPRLSQSLFYDERENLMYAIDGLYQPDGSGGVRFIDRDWDETLWWYEMPANHVLHSVLARVSLSAWRIVADPEHRMVNETALRIPAFLAGLASIAAAGWMLARQGLPVAGVVAGWILAIHPWHVRYASEARGYSLGMLGIPVLLACLAAVLERGSWRRWALYAAVQGLLVWNHPSWVYFVAAVNLAAVFVLGRRARQALVAGCASRERQQLTRLLVANVASGSAVLWLLAPMIPQFVAFSQRPTGDILDAQRAPEAAWHFLTGPAVPVYTEGLGGLALTLVACAALAAALAGSIRLLWAGGFQRLMLPVLILPTLVLTVVAWATGANFFPQYLVSGLPGAVIVTAVGLSWGAQALPRRPAGAALLGAVAVFAWVSEPARSLLRERPVQPLRESVLATRPDPDPRASEHGDTITLAFDYFVPVYYDPRIESVVNREELGRWMATAQNTGQELFVNVAQMRAYLEPHQEFVSCLSDSGHFEEVASFSGLRPRDQRRIWRYRGNDPGAPPWPPPGASLPDPDPSGSPCLDERGPRRPDESLSHAGAPLQNAQ